MRGPSLKEQLWVLVLLGRVKGNHTRSGCLGRADLLPHQEDGEGLAQDWGKSTHVSHGSSQFSGLRMVTMRTVGFEVAVQEDEK